MGTGPGTVAARWLARSGQARCRDWARVTLLSRRHHAPLPPMSRQVRNSVGKGGGVSSVT
jgi:hypothetical protein